MASVVEILVLLATLGFIALPLLGRFNRPATAEGITEGELSELLYKKDAAYTALKDLDFDHRTGKIDRADYDEMKKQFEADAMAVIKTIEEYQAGTSRGASSPSSNSSSNVSSSIAPADQKYCTSCGGEVKPTDKFCASCGTALG